MAPREQKGAISKILVNQWRNEPSCCHRLAHHLAFTKSAQEPNGMKLSFSAPLIKELRASWCDRVAVSRIGLAFDGAR
jgi:hypothetical protein